MRFFCSNCLRRVLLVVSAAIGPSIANAATSVVLIRDYHLMSFVGGTQRYDVDLGDVVSYGASDGKAMIIGRSSVRLVDLSSGKTLADGPQGAVQTAFMGPVPRKALFDSDGTHCFFIAIARDTKKFEWVLVRDDLQTMKPEMYSIPENSTSDGVSILPLGSGALGVHLPSVHGMPGSLYSLSTRNMRYTKLLADPTDGHGTYIFVKGTGIVFMGADGRAYLMTDHNQRPLDKAVKFAPKALSIEGGANVNVGFTAQATEGDTPALFVASVDKKQTRLAVVEVPSGKALWDKVFPFATPELRYTGARTVCVWDPTNKTLMEFDQLTGGTQTLATLPRETNADDVSIVSVQ